MKTRFFFITQEFQGKVTDTIVKVNALLCKQYYCDKCDKGFKNRTGHKCQVRCNVCGRENCEKKADWQICPDCNKEVRSQDCFIAHKIQKKVEVNIKMYLYLLYVNNTGNVKSVE